MKTSQMKEAKRAKLQSLLMKSKNNQPAPKKQTQSEKIENLLVMTAGAARKTGGRIEKQSLTEKQRKHLQKLKGGQFRWLNELLYTSHSSKALSLFSEQPELFKLYHEGFSSQVKDWPVNPNQIFISQLENLENLVVADMGCGEAEIAQKLHSKLEIHSFDLHAANRFITCCDISKTPLKDKYVDICIFSLALMGTNNSEFIKEASRILKVNGYLKIAEVRSRIESEEQFINDISKFGFNLISKDAKNKMFIILEFQKSTVPLDSSISNLQLKPCIYKRR